MQFDFSSFIYGKTSKVVFLWKYISIIYIYRKSHKVRQTQLVRKESTCKRVQAPLSPATWIRSVPVAVGCWLGAKKMLLKKIK